MEGGIKGNPVGLARFKATPVLKKEVANFNSPVERVRGTYRSQGGCVLLRGCCAPAAGRKPAGWSRCPCAAATPSSRRRRRHPIPPQNPLWGVRRRRRKGRGRCEGRRWWLSARRGKGATGAPLACQQLPKSSPRARFLRRPEPRGHGGIGDGPHGDDEPRCGVGTVT